MTEPTTNQEETVDESTEEETSSVDGSDGHASGPSGEAASPDDDVAGGGGDSAPTGGEPDAEAAPEGDGVGGRGVSSRSADSEQTELVALREEFENLNDRHLRLVAEFNNFRRRSEQERMSAWQRAQADLVGNFLEVLDDLHRVADLDLSNATVEAIMEGIDLVERKFMRELEEAGVEVLEPTGEVFDPERMEAMMRVPAEEDDQVDTVAQVFQKGYSLKGILVRPARVSVYTQG